MSAHLVNPVGPDDHARGPADAKLTVVEYGDYQCPYCGQAYSIVEKLSQTFASSMRLVFRNLPLGDVHPHAERAAEFAEAAGLQDKFWPMHDKLYQNQRSLDDEALRSYAKDGICERALFVINRDKTIAWSYVSPVGVSPGADGALSAVEALS